MCLQLKFTPLEFETFTNNLPYAFRIELKFTPLEFETRRCPKKREKHTVKIYSVGVWNHQAQFT